MTTVAHAADWHIAPEKAMRDPETGLNARMMDRYRCARFTIADAVARGADLIAHCGDVSNSWHWTPTIARLAKQAFEPALAQGKPVVIVLGNHDDVRNRSERHGLDLLADTPGVHIIDRPCLLDVWEGPSGLVVDPSPEQRPDPDGTLLQLACLPYPNPSLLLGDEALRAATPADRNLVIREKMLRVARGLGANRVAGVPRLLLGHFSIDVAEAGPQSRFMMLGGEFSLPLPELRLAGFDGILLGHIHRPQVFPEMPWAGYCGSPEACSFAEEGENKGYYLHELTDGLYTSDFIATPYRQLVTFEPDSLEHFERAFALATEPATVKGRVKGSIVRLRLPLGLSDHRLALRRALLAAGAFEVRAEQVRPESARRVRESDVSATQSLEEQLNAWAEQHPETEGHMAELLAEAHLLEQEVGGGGGAA